MEGNTGTKEHTEDRIATAKEAIARRNEGKEAMNSHMMNVRDGEVAILVITYKDGTFDRHAISLNRNKFFFIVEKNNDLSGVLKYERKHYHYKLELIQGGR